MVRDTRRRAKRHVGVLLTMRPSLSLNRSLSGKWGPGPRFPHTDERVPGPRTAARHDTHTSCRPLTTASHLLAHSLGNLQPTRDTSYCCFSQALSAADETPPVITQGSPR